MKGILFLLFLFTQCKVFAQIGFVSNVNPKFKHLHAEVGANIGVESTEVFDYDLNIFLTKIFEESKVEIKSFPDFDFDRIDGFKGFQERKRIEYLDDYCKRKGIKGLIIFYRNNLFPSSSPYKNLYNLKFDFGIVTQIRKKKSIYFMNRTLMAYYNSETKKLDFTRTDINNQYKEEFIKVKSEYTVVDENNKLVNSESIQKDLINQYELFINESFINALKNIN